MRYTSRRRRPLAEPTQQPSDLLWIAAVQVQHLIRAALRIQQRRPHSRRPSRVGHVRLVQHHHLPQPTHVTEVAGQRCCWNGHASRCTARVDRNIEIAPGPWLPRRPARPQRDCGSRRAAGRRGPPGAGRAAAPACTAAQRHSAGTASALRAPAAWREKQEGARRVGWLGTGQARTRRACAAPPPCAQGTSSPPRHCRARTPPAERSRRGRRRAGRACPAARARRDSGFGRTSSRHMGRL